MTYVSPNYKTKKDLKAALAKGEAIRVFQPGIGDVPVNGVVYLEGPHSPSLHAWQAQGLMRDGRLVHVV